MRSAFFNGIRVSLGALLLLFVRTPMRAQEPQIDILASQIAESLSQSKQKGVIVLDFVGTDEMDALGQRLADDFRIALAKSAHGFQVQDRSQLLELLRKNELVRANLRDEATAKWLVRQTSADTWISGTLSTGIGGLRVTVEAFRLNTSNQISKFETSLPITNDLKALIGQGEKGDAREFSSVPRAGQNGYSDPACIYCPTAQYTAEASRREFEGTVLMDITVDTEGYPKNIRVTAGLPYGLTPEAIEAVQGWRLKPSTGPDGRPAAVRMAILVIFRLP
jgi:TonB family protein